MRTSRRRRAAQAGLAAVAAATAVAVPASGQGTPAQATVSQTVQRAAPVRTTTVARHCTAAVATAGSDGSVRAVARCDSGLVYLTGKGSSWTRSALPGTLRDARALSIADDGTASYLLADQVPVPGNGRVTRVVRVDRHGAVTKQWTLSTNGWSSTGAIAARGGNWWALWSELVPGVSSPRLFHAETGAGGAVRLTPAFENAQSPSLAWNGSILQAVWTRGGRYPYLTVRQFKKGRWDRNILSGVDHAGTDPSQTTTALRTAIAFQRPGRGGRSQEIMLSTRIHRQGRPFVLKRIDTVTRSTDLRLTSRGEHLALAWTDDPAANGFGTAAVRVGNGSTWAVRRLGAGSRVVGAVWPGPKLVVLRIVQVKTDYGLTTNLVADQL